jgi:hypothetical protein
MNPETPSAADAPPVGAATLLDHLAARPPSGTIRLESCSALDWITVRTLQSAYDVIVLAGGAGDVMIRGGRLFPQFRRARIVGSTFGGSAAKLRSICVGLHLELCVDGKSFVTSRIEAASRRDARERERSPFEE